MRKSLKNALDFYINSSIHVSIAVVCLTAVTSYNFRLPASPGLLVFIFLATITGYNFVKYAGIAKLHHFTLAKNLRALQIFSFIAFIGLLVSSWQQPVGVLILATITGAFTVLYALPVFSENRNLRGLPGLKIYVIALVVAAVTVLMPLVSHLHLWQWDVILDFFQRFVLVIALVLPFEIRDLHYDMAQLGTLPQKLGIKKTKLLGYMLLGIFVMAELLKHNTHMAYLISIIFLALIAWYFIKKSTINQGKYFSSFWVEAIPIAWLGILILLVRII